MVGHARHHGQVGAGAEGEDQMIVMDLPRAAQRIADHQATAEIDVPHGGHDEARVADHLA